MCDPGAHLITDLLFCCLQAYLAQMQARLHTLRRHHYMQQQVLRRRAANAQPYAQVAPGLSLPCSLSWVGAMPSSSISCCADRLQMHSSVLR